MIFLRSTLFNLFFFGFTAVLCVLGAAVRYAAPERAILVPMLWARWTLAALRVICGIRVEIIGRTHLPASGPALIASKHQSAFDTMVWLTLLPRCCYVLKKELTRIPLFGGMARPAGMIVVDRKAGQAAMRHLMREADRAKQEGRQVVIFPEGTRGDPGRPLPLQPGIAAMAGRTGLAVIPGTDGLRALLGAACLPQAPGRDPHSGASADRRRGGARSPHAGPRSGFSAGNPGEACG